MEDYQSWPVFTKTIFLFSQKEINLSPQAFAFCSEQRFESVLRRFRKLKRTNQTPRQRTSQHNMNNYCHWKGPRPVGRTQKTPFPLSSDSKASLSSDFGTNSNSCASKSRRLSTASSFRKSSHLGTSRITYWNHQLDSLYQNLANGNCPWLWEAGSNSNEYNACKTESPFFQCLSSVSPSVFRLASDLFFDCSRVLEYAKIRTVLPSNRALSARSLWLLVGPPMPNRSKDRD